MDYAARFVFRIVRPLWHLTGTSAALLPMCQFYIRAMRWYIPPISWLRDFNRSHDKTSFWILEQGPGAILFTLLTTLEISIELATVYFIVTQACPCCIPNVIKTLQYWSRYGQPVGVKLISPQRHNNAESVSMSLRFEIQNDIVNQCTALGMTDPFYWDICPSL